MSSKIKKAIGLLEDFAVTTASLAPYPVAAIGQPVKVTKKKRIASDDLKEKFKDEKYAGVPVVDLYEAGIGMLNEYGFGVPKNHATGRAIAAYKREHGYCDE